MKIYVDFVNVIFVVTLIKKRGSCALIVWTGFEETATKDQEKDNINERDVLIMIE